MFDTHAIARAFTDAGIHTGALATKADVTMLKTEVAALEARIYKAMLVQAGAIVGAVIGILRFLD